MPGAEPSEIAFYEGLIRKTAAIYAPRIQEDYEDIVQILRVKVWRALLAYDPNRSTQRIERFVFSCVTNQIKDLLKRKRRTELYIEDLARTTVQGDELADGFLHEYLAVGHDEVYGEVERELPPAIPETLTDAERELVVRLYLDSSHHRAALELKLTRAELETAVASIRVKMAEYHPAGLHPLAA